MWHVLVTALPLVWAYHMILVVFFTDKPGMTLMSTQTTLVTEFFQSLCRITFQGGSVRFSSPVCVFSASYVLVMVIYNIMLSRKTNGGQVLLPSLDYRYLVQSR